ncbi:MAG: DUF1553 domain-containing protein [Candidatus Omnitrophica bacterium]|nr:DUF1553 domain-containing protein [Candidatus Omnitrophota bacterium]
MRVLSLGMLWAVACVFPDSASAELSEDQTQALNALVDNLALLIEDSTPSLENLQALIPGLNLSAPRAVDEAALAHFEARVRPVLLVHCASCHGGEKPKSGLRVDSRESLLAGGKGGSAILPGNSEGSRLIQALRYTHDDLKMPPSGALPKEVVDDLARWIDQGAPWPEKAPEQSTDAAKSHWAFQPVKRIEPPADPSGWSDHPIDRFIKARLAGRDLEPVGMAEKRTLLRRVTFDLIGLPPTVEEMRDFLADHSPDAWNKVIERLLASPRYGERWGRHWMDVARYADTAGDAADYPVPELHFYRDYIIDSFNSDKPYDQFVREQIAGDILARRLPKERYPELVTATSFVALSRRFGTGPYQDHHQVIEDTIDTVGKAFMGLSISCARCHDHKFDPITTRDYYGLYGIFKSTNYPYAGSETFVSDKHNRRAFVTLLPPEEVGATLKPHRERATHLAESLRYLKEESQSAKRIAELDARIGAISQVAPKSEGGDASLVEPIARLVAELSEERDRRKAELDAELGALQEQLRNLDVAGLPEGVTGVYAVSEGDPADAPIHKGGNPGEPGEVVPRGAPAFLPGGGPFTIPPGSSGRLQLAEWVTRSDHPLTARVMVNRIWRNHFGKGLVASPSNFGLTGAKPTHPELLDWLASEFVARGWSIKEMHRLILSSKTYRLASTHDPRKAEADPDNDLYWRWDRRRLDAESIRDAMLAVSGVLDLSRPKRHPFPAIQEWKWTQHGPFRAVYPSNHRSVYLMTQRIQRHPYLALFDGPDTNRTVEARRETTAPLQALFLANNPFVTEQARALAAKTIEACTAERERGAWLIERALSRPASAAEIERSVTYLSAYKQELEKSGAKAEELDLEAWTSYARVVLSSNEFFFLD